MNTDLLERSKNALLTGDLSQAEKLCVNFLRSSPDSLEGQLILGSIFIKLGKLQSAQKAFEAMLRKEPNNADALINSAIVYQKRGKLKTALQAAMDAKKLEGDRADIIFNIGNIHRQLGELKKAEEVYRLAVEKNPDFVAAYNNLALLLEEAGNVDEAEKLLKQGLAKDPNHPGMHFNLANLNKKKGDYSTAEKEFRLALKINPGWEECLLNLGDVLKKDKRNEALRYYKRVLDLSPESVEAKCRIGEISLDEGDFEQAETIFTEILTREPQFTPAAVNLAAVYYAQKKLNEAEKILRDQQNNDPDNIELRLLLGNILLETAKYNEAFSHIRFVLDRNQNESRAWFAMARQFSLSGKKERALNTYRKGLKIDPDAHSERMQLALLLKSVSRIDAAVAECEYIYDERPDDFEPALLLSKLYSEKKNFKAAYKIVKKLSAADPENIELLKLLAQTAKEAGFTEDAFKAAADLASLTNENDDDFSLEDLSKNLDLYDEMAVKYAEDYGNTWKKNLRTLSKTMEPEKIHEEGSFLFNGIQDLAEEFVPILDVGGIDPVILINEEEETLTITDEDEYFPPPEEDEEQKAEETQKTEEKVTEKTETQSPSGSDPVPGQPIIVKLDTPPIIYRERLPENIPEAEPEPEPELPDTEQYNETAAAEPAAEPPEQEEPEEENLFGYLDKLTNFLPPDKKSEYSFSDAKLKIAALKAKMDGDPGLLSKIDKAAEAETASERSEFHLTMDKIGNTLGFMTKMSESLPDLDLAETLSNRIKNIVNRLQETKEVQPDD